MPLLLSIVGGKWGLVYGLSTVPKNEISVYGLYLKKIDLLLMSINKSAPDLLPLLIAGYSTFFNDLWQVNLFQCNALI